MQIAYLTLITKSAYASNISLTFMGRESLAQEEQTLSDLLKALLQRERHKPWAHLVSMVEQMVLEWN